MVAYTLVDSVAATLDRVHAATKNLPRPTVFIPTWDRPLIAIGGGSFLSQLLDIAGARNIYEDIAAPSAVVTIEDVAKRNPEYVMTSPAAAPNIGTDPKWRALSAVRQKHVLVYDTLLVGRPSGTLGAAARSIADLLHPGAVREEMRASRWTVLVAALIGRRNSGSRRRDHSPFAVAGVGWPARIGDSVHRVRAATSARRARGARRRGLGISGAALQGRDAQSTRRTLSAWRVGGAAVGAVLAVSIGLASAFVPLAAFAGAIAAVVAAFMVRASGGRAAIRDPADGRRGRRARSRNAAIMVVLANAERTSCATRLVDDGLRGRGDVGRRSSCS